MITFQGVLVNKKGEKNMLRSQFEEDLLNLHNQFYEMGMLVSKAIHRSVRAYVNHDKELAKQVIEHDEEINNLEIQLEKKSFEMIALQQPVTTDLRRIITVMKASSDLERMGDHAVSISKSTILVKGQTRIPKIEKEISDMSDSVKKMVDNVLVAYVKMDQQDAKMIAAMDERVNQHFRDIYDHTIEAMKANPDTVISGTDYLNVAQYLERIGDYVTNICEWIVYLATGKITELNSNRTAE
jgi:phosphate transport system protein